MTPRSVLSAIRRQTLLSFCARRVRWGNRGPLVSFTFDDFPRTAYLLGGTILNDIGVRATYYAAAGLMNTTNHLGEQFRSEDIHCLLQDGHELASHTFSHVSCRAVGGSAYADEVDRGRTAIRKVAGVADSGNFAYPFGDVTLQVKKSVGSRVCSSRSIFPGLNGPDVDLNLLRANRLYGDLDQLGKAQQLILETEKRKSWLVFYSHDVRPTPSAYGCTPSLLKSTVSFAIQQGCRVVTVREALAEIGACCA